MTTQKKRSDAKNCYRVVTFAQRGSHVLCLSGSVTAITRREKDLSSTGGGWFISYIYIYHIYIYMSVEKLLMKIQGV